MSDNDLEHQVSELFSEQDAPPALGGLFSDQDAPSGELVRASPEERALRAKSTRRGARKPHRPRLFSRERLALSVEAGEIRAIVARGQRIVRWGRVSLPAGTLRNGEVVQLDRFGEKAAELIDQVDGPRRKVVVGLMGQRSLVRVLGMPPVSSRMMAEAVRRTARRELPLPLDEVYLSWQAVGDQDDGQPQIFLLGVPRETVDGCVVGLQRAGVRLQAMDLKPLALVRAANHADVILADLEAQTVSVALVRGFVPYMVRSVPRPGGAADAPGERAESLVAEIQRTLDFYDSTRAAEHAPWTPSVCLTGGLADQGQVREQVAEHWTIVDPTPPLPVPDDLPLAAYLAGVGLVLKRAT